MKDTKTVNEEFGISNQDYKKWSGDIGILCVDKMAETGEISFIRIAKYLIEEVRFKHFGKTESNLSSYEKELVLSGMILRYIMSPEVQTSVQIAAYGKQLENGLNGFCD